MDIIYGYYYVIDIISGIIIWIFMVIISGIIYGYLWLFLVVLSVSQK